MSEDTSILSFKGYALTTMLASTIFESRDISDAKASIKASTLVCRTSSYSNDFDILSPEDRSNTTLTMSPSSNPSALTEVSPISIL